MLASRCDAALQSVTDPKMALCLGQFAETFRKVGPEGYALIVGRLTAPYSMARSQGDETSTALPGDGVLDQQVA